MLQHRWEQDRSCPTLTSGEMLLQSVVAELATSVLLQRPAEDSALKAQHRTTVTAAGAQPFCSTGEPARMLG